METGLIDVDVNPQYVRVVCHEKLTQLKLPEEVDVETPSQTEVILRSHNKQVLGQAAAEIRSFRPPEPYKGKGVRYSDEQVKRKEAKKAAGAGA